MKRSSCAVAVLAMLVAAFGASATVGQESSSQDFVTLFDGSDLDQWVKLGDANWTIEGDVVQADSGNGYLVSAQSYGDFPSDAGILGRIRTRIAASSFAARTRKRSMPAILTK